MPALPKFVRLVSPPAPPRAHSAHSALSVHTVEEHCERKHDDVILAAHKRVAAKSGSGWASAGLLEWEHSERAGLFRVLNLHCWFHVLTTISERRPPRVSAVAFEC